MEHRRPLCLVAGGTALGSRTSCVERQEEVALRTAEPVLGQQKRAIAREAGAVVLGGPCTGKCIICRASCASRNLRWGPPNGACRHEFESVKLWLEIKGRIYGSREVPTHGADNGGVSPSLLVVAGNGSSGG